MTARGRRRHLVTIQSPTGNPAANGDGGFTQNFTTVATVRASIDVASVRSLERLTGGAVLSQATHTIGLPYTASVAAVSLTSKIVAVVTGKTYNVLGILNPGELNRELIVTASEVVQ